MPSTRNKAETESPFDLDPMMVLAEVRIDGSPRKASMTTVSKTPAYSG
ncbi:hypothetical protein [Nonomuraea zeae]|nr:hypothetical protein [Nonomuraea zeae]